MFGGIPGSIARRAIRTLEVMAIAPIKPVLRVVTRVEGLGFRVLGFGVWSLGFVWVEGLGFRVLGLGFGV